MSLKTPSSIFNLLEKESAISLAHSYPSAVVDSQTVKLAIIYDSSARPSIISALFPDSISYKAF